MIAAGWGVGFLACIVAANWAIQRWGLVPVAPGLLAPAGVYFAGLAFTARDLFQDGLHRRGAPVRGVMGGVILLGAGLSALISPGLALASGTAFLLSELADFFVYSPLRARRWLLAVAASNVVGFLVDSTVFLWLAFGSLQYFPGQAVGKAWTTLAAVALLAAWRRWR